MTDLERTKYLRDLRRKMYGLFDLDELRTLAFDLSVDWDTLPGEEKNRIIQSLIMHQARRGRLGDLITLLREERPGESWPDVPASEQQIEDEKDIVPDSLREAALQDYLDKMNQYVVSKRSIGDYSYRDDTIAIARAYTDAVVRRLDKPRLVIICRYLGNIGLSRVISLQGGDLSKVDLSGADICKAKLSETNLTRTKLCGVNLSGADLSRANLSGANLRRTSLGGADLREADLSNADLREVDLSKADLSRANLSGADLSRAILNGADLFAAYLTERQLRSAKLDPETIMPDGSKFSGWPEG